MKLKILLAISGLFLFSLISSAQFSCTTAIGLNDGFSSTVSTPGTGGIEDWVNTASTCSASSSYFTASDVYLFSYTTVATDEFFSFDVISDNTWTAAMAFTSCSGDALSGCIDDDSNGGSSGALQIGTDCTSTLPSGTTVYFAVGQWGGLGDPHDLDFSVSFSAGSSSLCSDPNAATDDCSLAPSIDFTEEYVGSTDCCYTDSEEGQLCGAFSIDNNSWIQFTAASSDIDIDYNVTNCSNGDGIQIGIFEGDCNSFSASFACENNVIGPGDFQISGLTPGESYYIMIDGWAGDLCDFSFTPDGGIVVCDNDICANAETISCNDPNIINGIQCATANDADDNCDGFGSANAGLWYSFTGNGDDITFSVNNPATNFNANVHVYEGSCGSKSCVSGASGNGTDEVTFTSSNGANYFIYIDGDGGDIGIYELSIDCNVAPTLGCGGTFTDSGGLGGEYDSNADPVTDNWLICPDSPGETVTLTFTSFDVEGTSNSTCWDILQIYSGMDDSGILFTNETISGNICGTTIPGPFISFDPSGCLYITFESDSFTEGDGWVAQISCDPCSAPTNDMCANAIPLTINSICMPIVGTTECAFDSEYSDTDICTGDTGEYAINDVWYSFEATSTTHEITATGGTSANEQDIVLSLYTNCGGASIDCQDAFFGGGQDSETINASGLTVGQTYYIRIYSHMEDAEVYTPSGQESEITVCVVGDSSSCASADECDTAESMGATLNSGDMLCLPGCVGPSNTDGIDLPGNNCYDFSNPTVWFTFETGPSLAGVTIDLSNLAGGEFALYASTDCFTFLANDNWCGIDGSSLNAGIAINTTYYIAVSADVAIDDDFDLCISGNADNTMCNVDNTFTENSSSDATSPVGGPYSPGETVEFCYTINEYRKENCNWLQAISPSWGDCWVETSGTEPTVTTALTQEGVESGSWSWFTEGSATFNVNHPNGDYSIGDNVAAAWIFVTNLQGPDPDDSYGDGDVNGAPGSNCDIDGNGLTWTVCFELTAGDVSFCPDDVDCSVSVKTYADGEIGAWENTGCSLDNATNFTADLNCVVPCSVDLEASSMNGFACMDDDRNLTTITNWNETVSDGFLFTGFVVFCNTPTLPITEAYYDANALDAILETTDNIGDFINTNGDYVDPISGEICSAGSIYLLPITIASIDGFGSFVIDWACFDTEDVIEVELGVPPIADATADPITICAGESSELTATGGGTYLWSDGLGTNPVVTVMPTSTTTYSVTVTDASGNCTDTANVTVTVTDPGTEPTTECWETSTLNTTTCMWDITGIQPTEPTTECWEIATFNDGTCMWDVTGTQPTVPTTACYQTATFNDGTCMWDVTGTQPTEPTTECYETATFNDGTCMWDVTGTQPTEPTTECYETSTFNDGTCMWDVTGTQPTEPTTECYETSTFNDGTCMWDVTGTQPTVPTTACYETATFNDGTCMWDVTGTQPTEPTTECYETSTFNDGTCMWDVTGTQPTEPTTECYETATFNDGTCMWDVTGTQPTEPTTECYETATFTDGTCMWDVTGTQPTEPTTECYETSTFNDGTCMWDVTGTQPTEPTTECYETATFNDGTCMWDVTGTQPIEPTTECYETATFNDGTCMWDVTGTQPTEPTTECYETTSFNDGTCMWDVTGTQPTEPTTECYETATFNDGTCMWDVTGTQPTEPTTECWESTSFNDVICMWDVSGTQPTEPSTECYETASFNDVTCMWDVSGTQPTEPSTECYETATFNDVTCIWDVSGTQPTEPTTECYETATFNDATCIWVVTGTQPTEPSTECYEITTFNDVTCIWDVTGTQPTEPTTECWESTSFNDVTCMWDVAGTQPSEPTTECWESTTFNDGTCMWDVTGTQPTEPTTECYETATFNDGTCMWDVTGTQPTEPTTECYETATFNDVTCIWVVTGTQPTESSTECYETTTFNNVTCIWDVTGIQPTEPTTECWESTSFNDVTCMWDITGTQPTEPTTECWESTLFNDVTCMWDLTGTQPTEPSTECYETATFNDGTCMWDVTGTQPTEPTTECWETATFNDATCIWVVTGTQPTEPTTECYETTTFNDVTCIWDVSGTQPTEPTTECWESTSFNDVTCMWDVSGTQPTEPSTECYETMTFNDVTCIWDVTGTQPTEPTTECYETATFNDGTCIWDVTGTQPTEPTTECWETATFNNVTCIWVVTGTQPTEPTTECYETATFNDITCIWDVTGTQPTEPTTECWESTSFNDGTCMWDVSGTQPVEPATECYETATFNNNTCMWDATGTQPTEPTTECWETATFNDGTCMWDVTGAQPAEPTTDCWETATFNNATCIWVVTGTQPTEPTTECYETTTFNDITCIWDVTGTQPTEPTTDCWESTSFNDVTCMWNVSGTQPVEPTTECYETATFNDITCTWDVSGTQPIEPTVECYETATFNDATCVWDVTGIEADSPTFMLQNTYCVGDTPEVLPVTSDNGVTGTWNPNAINTSNPSTINYIFTPTDGCTAIFEIMITIEDCNCMDPAFVNIDLIDPICEDETIDLNAVLSGTATSLTWSTSGDGTFDNTTSTDPTYTPGSNDLTAGSVTLSVITDDPDGIGLCVPAEASTILTINAIEDPTFSLLIDYCAGDVVELLPTTSNNMITGTWMPDMIDNMNSGSYLYTPDVGQCANTFTLNVTIAPSNTPTFVIEEDYCINDTPDLLATTSDNGVDGTWSPAIITTNSAGSTNYFFTPTNVCDESFSISVIVTDCGCLDPAFVTIDPIDPICEDEMITLNAVLSGTATSVTWSTSGNGMFDNITSTTPIYTPGTTDITDGVVTLTATTDDPDGTGDCDDANATILLVINNLSDPIFNLMSTYCAGDLVEILSTTSNNSIVGTWTPSVIDDMNSGDYLFTPDAGQCANTFTLNVTITPSNTPTFVIEEDYCIDDTPDLLPTTSDNGVVGTWSPGIINTSTGGSTNYFFTPTNVCDESFSISVVVTDCGCLDPALVTIDPIDPICEDETITLNAVLSGTATLVTWSTSGNGMFDNSTSTMPIYTPGTADITDGVVTLTATTDDPDGTGDCSPANATILLVINSLSDPTFNLMSTYCAGDVVEILSTTSNNSIVGTWIPNVIDDMNSGDYLFTPDAGQCANTFTLNVTITPSNTPTFVIEEDYCIDDTPDLLPTTSDNGVEGTWSPGIINTSTGGSTNYFFTPTNVCDESFSISVVVTDCGCLDPALVTIDPIDPICEDEMITLNAVLSGTATSVTWSTFGNGMFDNITSTTPIYTPGTTDITDGVVTLTATTDDPDGTGDCSPANATILLVINSLSDPTFNLVSTYCAGDMVEILPTTSNNSIVGTWTSSVIDDMNSGDYLFTPDAGQCANTFTLNVTITPSNTPTFVIEEDYCIDDTPDLLPTTSDNGVEGTWSPGIINTSTGGSTNYFFTPTNVCDESFSISVIVTDCGCLDPALVTIDPIDPICEDEMITLNAVLSGTATSVTWSTSGNGMFDNSTSTTPIYTPGTMDITDGVVTLTATTDDPDGVGDCSPANATILLVINSLSDPTFNLMSTYCAGDMVDILPATSNNSIVGTWIPNVIDDMNSGDYLFTPDAGQCANTFTLNVTITPSNTPTFVIEEDYCIDDTPDLLPTTSDNGVEGTWSPDVINTSTGGSTNYFFTPTNVCDESFSISVVVTDCGCLDPALVTIDPIDPICEDETITLNAVLSGTATLVTWSTSGNGMFDNSTSTMPIYTPGTADITDGVVTLTATTDDPDGTGDCSPANATILLVINSLSDPTFNLMSTYCAGDVVEILSTTSNNSIVGTWTPSVIDDMNSGDYLFTPDAGQCANTFTLNVTITPSNTPTFVIEEDYCIDDTPDLLPTTSDNGVEGTWSPDIINTSTGGSTNYFFTPTNVCDESFSISVVVTDCGCLDPALVTIDPIDPICEDETITLNAVLSGTATLVTWSTSGNGMFDNSTSTTAIYTPGTADITDGVVTLTATTDDPDGTGDCSPANATILLVINSLSDPTFNLISTYCAGDMVDILPTTSNNNIAGTWTPSVIDDMNSGDYLFTPDAGQCANTFTLNVVISTGNIPTFIIDKEYCIDDTPDLLPTTSDNGLEGVWSPAIIETSTGGATDYFFTPTNSCDETISISVIVMDCNCADPAFVTIDPIGSICENQSIDLNAVISGSASSVTWTSTGDGTFDNTISLTPIYAPGPSDIIDGVVTLTVTTDDPDGVDDCSAAASNISLSINEIVDPIFMISDTFCIGTMVDILSTTSDNGVNGSWSPSVIDNALSGTYVFTPNTNECANPYSISIIIDPCTTSECDLILTTNVIDESCFGLNDGSVELMVANGVEPMTYTWSDNNLEGPNVDGLSPGTYTVNYNDAMGCTGLFTFEILEGSILTLEVTSDETLVPLNTEVNLTGSTNISDDQIAQINWNISQGLDCQDCLETTAQILSPTNYILTIVDIDGCTIQDGVLVDVIKIDPEIYFPNVFSPNGDVDNQYFYPKGKNVEIISSLRIYDRWGNLIFENENFEPNDISQGWDGTYQSKPLNPGVFVYIASYKGIGGFEGTMSGDITIIR